MGSLGIAAHMLPVVHTLHACWPQTRLTWVIGTAEAALMQPLQNVELLRFHARTGLRAYRQLAHALRQRRFDGLFLMQAEWPAELASLLVRAPVRMGFDRARARAGHRLFINCRIAAAVQPHVLDGFMGFLAASGIPPEQFRYCWDIPEDPQAIAWAAEQLPAEPPFAVVSPCAEHPNRSWRPDRYATVADHLMETHGMQVAFTSSADFWQVRFVNAICARMRRPPVNLAGRTSLPQLLALLRRARFMLSPDSGAIHLATVAGIPAIGLYAASDPRHNGPFHSLEWCLSRYHEAAMYRTGRPASELSWGLEFHDPDVMALIAVEEVLEQTNRLIAHLGKDSPAAPE